MLHIKKLKPRYDKILVTGNRYENDEYKNGIIVSSKGDLKTNQVVLAVGSTVRDINAGDTIVFNPLPYAKRKVSPNSIKNEMDVDNPVIEWHLPWITIENEDGEPQDCLLLSDRDIEYVYEGYEKEETVIMPQKKKILLN